MAVGEEAKQKQEDSTSKDKEKEVSCIVKFRPCKDWSGEYGFDWVREESDVYKEEFLSPIDPPNNSVGNDKADAILNSILLLAQGVNANRKKTLSDKENVVEYAYAPVARDGLHSLVFAVKYDIVGAGLWKIRDLKYNDDWNGNVVASDCEKRDNKKNLLLNAFLIIESEDGSRDFDKMSCYVDEATKKVYLPYYKDVRSFSDLEPKIKKCKLNSKVSYGDESNTRHTLHDEIGFSFEYIGNKDAFQDSYASDFEDAFSDEFIIWKEKGKKVGFCLKFFYNIPYKSLKFDEEKDGEINTYQILFKNVLGRKYIFASLNKSGSQRLDNLKEYSLYFSMDKDPNNQNEFVVYDEHFIADPEVVYLEDKEPLKDKKTQKDKIPQHGPQYNAFKKFVIDNLLKYEDLSLPELSTELSQKNYKNIQYQLYLPNEVAFQEIGLYEEIKTENKTTEMMDLHIGDDIYHINGTDEEYVGYPTRKYIDIKGKKIPLVFWFDDFVLNNYRILGITHTTLGEPIRKKHIFYPVPYLTTNLSLIKNERNKFTIPLYDTSPIGLPESDKMVESNQFQLQYFMDENYDIPDILRLQSQCPMLSFKKQNGGTFEKTLEIENPGKSGTFVVQVGECSQFCDFCNRNNIDAKDKKNFYVKKELRRYSIVQGSISSGFYEVYKLAILARAETKGHKYLPDILPDQLCGKINVLIGDRLRQPLLFVKVLIKDKHGVVKKHSSDLDNSMEMQKEYLQSVFAQSGVSVDIHDKFEITINKKTIAQYQTKDGFLDTQTILKSGEHASNQLIRCFFMKAFFEKYDRDDALKAYSPKSPIIFVMDIPFTRWSAYQTFINYEGISEPISIIAVSNYVKNRKSLSICAHEIMHSLKLPHTFQLKTCQAYYDNDYCLRYLNTSNIMDYSLTLYSTRSFQWDKIREGVVQNHFAETYGQYDSAKKLDDELLERRNKVRKKL